MNITIAIHADTKETYDRTDSFIIFIFVRYYCKSTRNTVDPRVKNKQKMIQNGSERESRVYKFYIDNSRRIIYSYINDKLVLYIMFWNIDNFQPLSEKSITYSVVNAHVESRYNV